MPKNNDKTLIQPQMTDYFENNRFFYGLIFSDFNVTLFILGTPKLS